MTRIRWMLATLAVTLLVVLVIWANLPAIVTYLVERELRQLGFTEISIDIRQIDREQAKIDSLHASYPGVALMAREIAIEYSIAMLLDGRLEQLACQQLQVKFDPQPSATDETPRLPSLPIDWYSRLPVQAFNIEELQVVLSTSRTDFNPVELNGRIDKYPDNDLRAELQITTPNRDSLNTRIRVNKDGELVAELIDIVNSAPVFSVQTRQLAIHNNQLELLYRLDADLAALQRVLQGWIPPIPPALQEGSVTLNGGIGFDASTKSLHLTTDGQIQQITRQLHGSVDLVADPGQLSLQIAPAFTVSLHDQVIGDVSVPRLELKLAESAACQVMTDFTTWRCEPFSMDVSMPELQLSAMTMNSLPGKIAFSQLESGQTGWMARAEVDIPSPTIDIPDNRVQLEHLHFKLSADPGHIVTDGRVSATKGTTKLLFKADHNLAGQRGRATISLEPVNFKPGSNIPAQLLHRWPYPLHLEAGQLSANSTVTWRVAAGKPAHVTQAGTLKLEGLAGEFRAYPFSDLSATLLVNGIENLQVSMKEAARLGTFNPGIPFTNSQLRGTFRRDKGRQPRLHVSQFQSNVLGGKIAVDDTEIDLNLPRNPVVLRVEGLDIASLIALEQKQGLSGTGSLNGSLPLTLGKDGLHVVEGRLFALPPGGVIKYSGDERATELAKGNPGLELLLTALRDFRYHLLEADLDYTPDGQLLAKLRLEGKNPELQGGKPVHLNINLEENILALLRSLQLADEIGSRIGENIERGVKKH